MARFDTDQEDYDHQEPPDLSDYVRAAFKRFKKQLTGNTLNDVAAELDVPPSQVAKVFEIVEGWVTENCDPTPEPNLDDRE